MDKVLIKKMIRNCFLQYEHSVETVPLTENDYEELYQEIQFRYVGTSAEALHELIEDLVYEYLVG